MFEHFLPVEYDLTKSSWRTLTYYIDTYGGNSGSPVLRKSDLKAVGVHCYGKHSEISKKRSLLTYVGGSPNSASVIGVNGNKFETYIKAFSLADPKIKGMQLIHVGDLDESNTELSFKKPKGFPKLVPIAKVLGPTISAVLSATGVGAVAGIGKFLACVKMEGNSTLIGTQQPPTSLCKQQQRKQTRNR
jgi:hypothetical protein